MLAVVSDAPIMQEPPAFRHIPKKVLVIFDLVLHYEVECDIIKLIDNDITNFKKG
jgi:hypothetical protein